MKLLNVALFQIAFVTLCLGAFLLTSEQNKIAVSSPVKQDLVLYCDSNGECNVSVSAAK